MLKDFLLLMILSCILSGSFADVIGEYQLKDEANFRVVPKKEKNEIQKFASWFHQDWQLIFSSFSDGADQYLGSLTKERRAVLKKELEAFVEKNRERNNKSLLKEWLNLGAQGWDTDLPLYETLESFSQNL